MALNGKQKEKLQDALAAAFTLNSMKQALSFRLDKDLDNIVLEGGKKHRFFVLIETAEREGWTAELIKAAHNAIPRNQKLAAFVKEYSETGRRSPLRPKKPPTAEPEKPASSAESEAKKTNTPAGALRQFRGMVTKTLTIVLLGMVVAIALGTVFSQVYPTIKIDGSLALLLGITGLLIVLASRALWRAIKGDKT